MLFTLPPKKKEVSKDEEGDKFAEAFEEITGVPYYDTELETEATPEQEEQEDEAK